ncbi:unnamed protein product, partial [Didymodactylos carnosus]
MPSIYRPQIDGSIEIFSDKSESLLQDDNSGRDSPNYVEIHEKFIEDYMNQNSKRIKSSSSISNKTEEENDLQGDFQHTSPSSSSNETFSRRPSAKKLFEVNKWSEQQLQLKQRRSHPKNTTNASELLQYDEIKAATKELND